ncbi:hypothetical protein TYRP_016131 [Tyrophagus putrescentiae]|nr:hypothetical protein TYRP_016131 [Tyrophagus putrescentiae]
MKFNSVFEVFSRSFYTFSKQFLDRQNSYFWPAYYLDLAIIIFFSPRLLYVIYILRWGREQIPSLSTFDPAVHFLSKTDFTMVMLMLDFALFHIFCKFCLASVRNVKTSNWNFWRQLTVRLQDDYYQSRLTGEELELVWKNKANLLKMKYSLITTLFFPNWVLTLVARLIVWAKLENVDQSRFENISKLNELPHISLAIKRNAILLMLLIDQLVLLAQIGIAIITLFVLYAFRFELFLTPTYRWYTLVWCLSETTVVVYSLFRLLHTALFFTTASILAMAVQAAHCKSVQRSSLQQSLRSARADHNRSLNLAEMVKVAHFLAEHNILSGQIIRSNRELWGRVMAAFVITNLPLNIYALGQILLSGRPLVELVVLVLVISIQAVAFQVTMGPLAKVCETMHAPQQELAALQPYITGSRWILLKLKVDDLKLRLSCGRPKVAVSIGAARELTSETVLEFLGLYLAYVLVVFKQIRKNELN